MAKIQGESSVKGARRPEDPGLAAHEAAVNSNPEPAPPRVSVGETALTEEGVDRLAQLAGPITITQEEFAEVRRVAAHAAGWDLAHHIKALVVVAAEDVEAELMLDPEKRISGYLQRLVGKQIALLEAAATCDEVLQKYEKKVVW